jgi:hypothetical protein
MRPYKTIMNYRDGIFPVRREYKANFELKLYLIVCVFALFLRVLRDFVVKLLPNLTDN